MMDAHLTRDKAIKHCIAQSSEEVGQLREQRAKDSENLALLRLLRKEQTKVGPVSHTGGFKHHQALRYGPYILMEVSNGCYHVRLKNIH